MSKEARTLLWSTSVGSLLGPFTGNEVTSTDHVLGGLVLFNECSFLGYMQIQYAKMGRIWASA